MTRLAVFVIDGHDIDLYPDAEGAAREIEGYDALGLDYFGVDGTVYEATVEGPEWGPVTLHSTQQNRLDDLIRLLRTEAEHRGLPLPSATPDDPETIWLALLAAQEQQESRVPAPVVEASREVGQSPATALSSADPLAPTRAVWRRSDTTRESPL